MKAQTRRPRWELFARAQGIKLTNRPLPLGLQRFFSARPDVFHPKSTASPVEGHSLCSAHPQNASDAHWGRKAAAGRGFGKKLTEGPTNTPPVA